MKGSYAEFDSYLRRDVEFDSYIRQDVELNSYLRRDVEFNSYFRVEDLAQVGEVQADTDGRILVTADGRKRRIYR